MVVQGASSVRVVPALDPKVMWNSGALVEHALRELGAGSKTQLATVLQLRGGYQTVHRWTQGAEPNYSDTMKMLSQLGWLRVTDPAEETSETLDSLRVEVVDRVASLWDALSAIRTRVEQLEADTSRKEGGGRV